MKKILLGLILLLGSSIINAQLKPEMYYHNGKVYNNAAHKHRHLMSSFEVAQNLYNQSEFLCKQYQKGKDMKVSGGVLMGVGIPALATSIIMLPMLYREGQPSNSIVGSNKAPNRWDDMHDAAWALLGFGVGLTSVGIPLYSVGLKTMKTTLSAYNETSATLTFNLQNNGLGLALNF